ncbi:hypothetical protein DFH08DRAFT_805775 [Mycena albidolilacea]|uniref:Uncharacterized protein n=1 Tax=Mycena albidolilacea TaxID=1033008 RepID=A0AAD7EW96_9AGAR|nr:hypothetical protein DFH08DRAFT_805775 [Mycena albidolilacea]
MVPPTWTTPNQLTLLQSFMADFLCRQAEKKLYHFWPTVYSTWFSCFPKQQLLELPLPFDPMARTLTEEELKILTNPVDQSAAVFKLESVIAAPQAKKCARHSIQVFQTWNREAIRAKLTDKGYDQILERNNEEDNWTDKSDSSEAAHLKVTRAECMYLRTRIVTAMWKEASEEERAAMAVQAKLNTEQESTAPKTPAQLQDPATKESPSGVDTMDALFAWVHGAAHQASNWVGMTIIGRLHPRMAGELSMKIICFGETTEGNNFEDFCIDFDKHIVESFEGFLCQVFSVSECCAQALESEAVPANDDLHPVTVIPLPTPEPVPEPLAPKKKGKSKSKSKSKNKESVLLTVAAPQVVAPTQPVALVQPLPTTVGDSNNNSLEYKCVLFQGVLPFTENSQKRWLIFPFPKPFPPPPPANLWPAGMPLPLSLAAAAALVLQERGPTAVAALAIQEHKGAAVGPTIAMNPSLDLDIPFQPQPSLLFQAFQRDLPSLPPKPAPFSFSFYPHTPSMPQLCPPRYAAHVFPQSLANYILALPPIVPALLPALPPVFTPALLPVVTPVPPPVFTPVQPPVVTPAPPAPAKQRGRPPKATAALADTTNHTVEEGQTGRGSSSTVTVLGTIAKLREPPLHKQRQWSGTQWWRCWQPSTRRGGCTAQMAALSCFVHASQRATPMAWCLDQMEKAMLAHVESVRAENEMLKGKRCKALAVSTAPTVAQKRCTGA